MESQPTLQVCRSSKIRGSDKHGSGYYGAPRGTRKHKGIDLVCTGGTLILAPCDGVVTKCNGRVYSDPKKAGWRYVEIKDNNDVHLRFFYVKNLNLSAGQRIEKGDILGAAQGIEYLYEGIEPHIHFETRMSKKEYINPNDYLTGLLEA